MNIMDFFTRGAQQQQPNQQQVGQVPLNQSQQLPNPAADPSLQQNQQQPNNQPVLDANGKPINQSPVDPLEAMADIWKLPEGHEANQPKSTADFAFGFKPADIHKNAAKLDFTKAIPQETLGKMLNGNDQEKMAAFMTALNLVGQQAFANASLVAAKTTESGIRVAGSQIESNLPTFIKQQTASNAVRSDNAFFKSEAAAPIVAVIEQQVMAKHPNATPAEITQHTREWMKNFMQAGLQHLEPNAQANSPSAKSGATDFSTWET